MAAKIEYPFVPKSNVYLREGQFFSIPLEDGRYGCGRVLARVPDESPRSRTRFIGAFHDWASHDPPTAESIAGAPIFEPFNCHVRLIGDDGGSVLGHRPLVSDGIQSQAVARSYMSPTNAAMGLARRLDGDMPPRPTYEQRVLTSPVTEDMLAPLATPNGFLAVKTQLASKDLKRINQWFVEHSERTLSIEGRFEDLEMLEHLPAVRHIHLRPSFHTLASIDGLRFLSQDITKLSIPNTKRRLDLAVLAHFAQLTRLSIEGQTKGIDVLSSLSSLEHLTLRSVTLADLDLLAPLSQLKALELKLGGTTNLAALPSLQNLTYFEAWLVRGLTDITPVGDVMSLRYLFLETLKGVEELPDLSRNRNLRRIHLDKLRNLRNVSALADAPALEELMIFDCPALPPESLSVLQGHPTLRAASIHYGSRQNSSSAKAILDLPAALFLGKDRWHTV